MTGFQKIEDTHECVSISNSVWSTNGRKNAALSAEVELDLNLVETVVCSMIGYDEGKIKAHVVCREVWELLTGDKLKSSQFAGDIGSIIRKIIELESKTIIEFECDHVKTEMVTKMK